jgi:hypothetical protein
LLDAIKDISIGYCPTNEDIQGDEILNTFENHNKA